MIVINSFLHGVTRNINDSTRDLTDSMKKLPDDDSKGRQISYNEVTSETKCLRRMYQ